LGNIPTKKERNVNPPQDRLRDQTKGRKNAKKEKVEIYQDCKKGGRGGCIFFREFKNASLAKKIFDTRRSRSEKGSHHTPKKGRGMKGDSV